MKIAPRAIAAFLRAPDAKIRAILVYGPDSGLVRERAAILAKTVVDDLDDPFRVANVAPAELRADPARLADEAAAIAMTGGRRVVRVRGGDETPPHQPIADWLAHGSGDALIIVEAGELAPRAPLRKLFEVAADAAALPCYGDDERSLEPVVRETLAAHDLRPSPEAMAFLVDNLGGDRMVSRLELEKLALYKTGEGTVELDDARACVGDSAAVEIDTAVLAAAEGDHGALDRALGRLFDEGTTPVGALRAGQRYFQRLHLAAGLVERGKSEEQAVGALRPPVFFRVKPRMVSQLRAWRRPRIARALEVLVDAEASCKRTGVPAAAVAARAFFTIANAAARGGGGSAR